MINKAFSVDEATKHDDVSMMEVMENDDPISHADVDRSTDG